MILDYNFFKKYQKLLIWVANTWLGDLYFRSNWDKTNKRIAFNWMSGKILEMYPESYTSFIEDFYSCKRCIKNENPDIQKACPHKRKILCQRKITNFFSKPHFALKVAYLLNPLLKIARYWWIPFVKVGGAFALTVDTFVPDSGTPGTNTIDGYVGRVNVATVSWATIRSGLGTVSNATEISGSCNSFTPVGGAGDQFKTLYRMICGFNTGPTIPAGDTINATASTKLSLFARSINTGYVTNVNVGKSAPVANTTIATTDYENGFADNTGYSTATATSGVSTAAYTVFILNISGRGNISKGAGVSNFAGRLDEDLTNTAPAGGSDLVGGVDWFMADNAANKPTLSVDHSVAVASTTSRRMLMGFGM